MKSPFIRRGIMTLVLAGAMLGVSVSVASAATTFSPGTHDFGSRQVGTTSPAQTFTLDVACSTSDLIPICVPSFFTPGVGVTDEFAQTNDCGTTLQVSPYTCTVSVTFTPSAAGVRTGTLKGSAGGPSASLSGTGTTPAGPASPGSGGQAGATAKKKCKKKKRSAAAAKKCKKKR